MSPCKTRQPTSSRGEWGRYQGKVVEATVEKTDGTARRYEVRSGQARLSGRVPSRGWSRERAFDGSVGCPRYGMVWPHRVPIGRRRWRRSPHDDGDTL